MSKGKKLDEDKPRMDLLSTEALVQISRVMGFGAKKYEDHNWRKGIQWSRIIAAAMRHLTSFNSGENTDPETGISHIAHLGCCAMFLLDYAKSHPELDDRYRESKVPSLKLPSVEHPYWLKEAIEDQKRMASETLANEHNYYVELKDEKRRLAKKGNCPGFNGA